MSLKMNYADYVRTQLATTAQATNAWDRRNRAVGEILADAILYAWHGVGKPWRSALRILGARAGRRISNA